ncbi:hypothetical protein GCM10010266_57190 [Streptomyces griseomycini]|nr:hypothetical protein GCM10010266_57190 [Streptomyces griseomycini]
MTGTARATNAPWNTRRWRRPEGTLRAVTLWASVHACFGVVCALSGTPVLRWVGGPAPSALGWAVAALAVLAALVCAAVARYGLRPPLRALLWAVCGLAAATAFSLLMDILVLLFGQAVDSWAVTANRALAAIGTLLLAATARAARRPSAVAAATTPATAVAAPPAASLRVHLVACAGTAAFLPYVVMKQIWAFGGTFAGVTGEETAAISERNGASGLWLTLESWGLDGTVLMAALGTFLLWGLVRPWGQVFPRRVPFLRGRRVPRGLPLTPALIGAATLVPYGVLGTGYVVLATAGVVTMRRGDFPTSADALLVGWIGMIAFAGYGTALAVAARSYRLRTRPVGRGG